MRGVPLPTSAAAAFDGAAFDKMIDVRGRHLLYIALACVSFLLIQGHH
jgi:hypothetical protein